MLPEFSVRKPYTVIVSVILILILGVISFVNLQTDLLPEIDLPYLVLVTSYPGASPEEVEMVVTRPIEQVVATTQNIKNISSVSNENSSMVILEFNNDVNMDSAIIEINSSLDLIKGMWSDSVGSPMLIRLNPDMLPVMIAAVDVEGMDILEVSDFTSQKIVPELESVSGVAAVSGVGILQESVEVYINPDKIEAINNKILDKVDSKLSEAGSELKDKKQELTDAKKKLEEEEKDQKDKLIEGEKAIATGKEQLQKGAAAITAGLAELNKTKSEINTGLDEMYKAEEELISKRDTLLAMGDKLPQEGQIQLAAILEGLKELEGKKTEAQMGLKAVEQKTAELEKEKTALEDKERELAARERQINVGKTVLKTEMDKARAQLDEGLELLEEKTAEFETARDKALESASIKGLISSKMISGVLAAQNFAMPAGYVEGEGSDYVVKVGDKIKDTNEMEELLLFDTGEEAIGKVFLKDVADIAFRDNSGGIYAKVNGNNAVMLTLQKQSNYSTSEVSKNIWKKVQELTDKNQGLNITALMDQGRYIDIVVDSVLNNIILGGILAIVILLLFLRDIKPTLVIALSVPVSIVFAVTLMFFSGVSMNVISLAGLALGVGMLVDNSIVVIENIYRLRNEGMPALKAAVTGAKEVAGAIIASTLTTACVFLPIVFTKGISRQIFTDMGLTIAYSLTASLIIALSLVPALSSSVLKKAAIKEGKIYKGFINSYEGLLKLSLKHRGIVLLFAVILLGLSGYLAYTMGTSFIPDMSAPQMSLSISMDEESTFEDITEMGDKVIDRIIGIDGIETAGVFYNQSAGGMGMGNIMGMGGRGGGSLSVYLLLEEKTGLNNSEIGQEILRLTDDLECKISVMTTNMDISKLGGSGMEILIKGRDLDRLQEIAMDIAKSVEDTEGTTNVRAGVDEDTTEMRIIVDKKKAMENGLTVAQVFSHVNSLLAGGKSATTLSLESKDYPVIVVDGSAKLITRSNLKDIPIKTMKDGEEIEILLGDITAVNEAKGMSSIRREVQERYLSVRADIDDEHNIGLVSRELEGKMKAYELPGGYKIEFSGENKMIKDSLRDLVFMLLLAIALIYLIMVAQFQSLLSPFIVMFTIPLAFTGGLLALAITGNEISIISMLGFLVLAGVVVNNGIVFVDYTNQLRQRGMERDDALVAAGKTRMKPILMTAITTILGLSTLAFGMGMGAEVLQPLAIVAIGGLTYATILTLIVVPAMYSLLHKSEKRSEADVKA